MILQSAENHIFGVNAAKVKIHDISSQLQYKMPLNTKVPKPRDRQKKKLCE